MALRQKAKATDMIRLKTFVFKRTASIRPLYICRDSDVESGEYVKLKDVMSMIESIQIRLDSLLESSKDIQKDTEMTLLQLPKIGTCHE